MSGVGTIREIRDDVQHGTRKATDDPPASPRTNQRPRSKLHAFNTVMHSVRSASAAAVDRHPQRATLPLAGVPVALKNNPCTPGSSNDRLLENSRTFVPLFDATVVTHLEAAGAVIVGKTNCDEFAMGSSTENSAFGVTETRGRPTAFRADQLADRRWRWRPEWCRSRSDPTPGDRSVSPPPSAESSGSSRHMGASPATGLLAFASSLDQIGPLTRTVGDAALALSVMAGVDRPTRPARRNACPTTPPR